MIRRRDLKNLVDGRLADAHVLMSKRRYASAYYIVGYAVECAIKVCIAGQFRKNTIPDKNLVNNTYTHDFEKLMKTAGIFAQLEQDIINDADLYSSWNVVKDWRPEIRYTTSVTPLEARDLIDAIENQQNGILQWLVQHW